MVVHVRGRAAAAQHSCHSFRLPRTRLAASRTSRAAQGNVVIFDEAHNIEDAARDAASEDVLLSKLQFALHCTAKHVREGSLHTQLFRPVYQGLRDLCSWLELAAASCLPVPGATHQWRRHWSGGEVLRRDSPDLCFQCEVHVLHAASSRCGAVLAGASAGVMPPLLCKCRRLMPRSSGVRLHAATPRCRERAQSGLDPRYLHQHQLDS